MLPPTTKFAANVGAIAPLVPKRWRFPNEVWTETLLQYIFAGNKNEITATMVTSIA